MGRSMAWVNVYGDISVRHSNHLWKYHLKDRPAVASESEFTAESK